MSEEAEKRMSKYATKKARQAKTGEVGYIVGEIKITTEPNKVRQSAAERRLQIEQENAGFAAQNALELIGKVYQAGVIRQGFEAMDKSALKTAVEALKLALAEATKILKAK